MAAEVALHELRQAARKHERAFRASQAAHAQRNRAILAARLAGASWEEVAEADCRRSPNGPEAAAHSTKVYACALWRSGKYGDVPDEALTVHERAKRRRPTPQPAAPEASQLPRPTPTQSGPEGPSGGGRS